MSRICRGVTRTPSVIDTLPARDRERIAVTGRSLQPGVSRVLAVMRVIGEAERRRERQKAQSTIRPHALVRSPFRAAHERQRAGAGRPAGRRTVSRSSGGGSSSGDDGSSDPAPARLILWRHPRNGLVNVKARRLLAKVEEDRSAGIRRAENCGPSGGVA